MGGLIAVAVANEAAIAHSHATESALLAILMFGGAFLLSRGRRNVPAPRHGQVVASSTRVAGHARSVGGRNARNLDGMGLGRFGDGGWRARLDTYGTRTPDRRLGALGFPNVRFGSSPSSLHLPILFTAHLIYRPEG